MSPPVSEPKGDHAARESTRGVAIITLAKGWFLLTGFAQPILLVAALKAEGYGLYGLALNVISILNNVVVAGSIQAMSRAVTEGGARALRRGLVLHLLLGLVLSGSLALGADLIGASALHDARLPKLLRIGAIVVGNYCVYAALVGGLNGQRRFVAQAGLDMTFATLRTALVVGLAFTAAKVTGAISGFAAASGVILVLALVLSRDSLRGAGETAAANEPSFAAFAKHYARFFAPVLVYQLALNLVFQADLLVLKALSSRLGHQTVAQLDRLAGIYKAVQTFAFLPYQLLLSVTFVIFPVVSRATFEGDRDSARSFIRGALRFSALALGLMLSVLTGIPGQVLRLAYKPPLDLGANALRVLSLAQGSFALTVLGTTILLAAGRTRVATLIMVAMLAGVMGGDAAGLWLFPEGIASINATATGTALGCGLGLALAAVYFRSEFGEFLSLKTFGRVALSTAVTAALGSLAPALPKPVTLVVAAALGAVYVTMLALTREVTAAELATVRRLIGRKAK